MTNKSMTRAQAIEFAIDNIAANCMGDMEKTGANEAIEVLEKMYAQITKPRKKNDAPSKARILNESLAMKCYNAMEGQENVTTKWLIEHVNGLMTPQKVTAVMKILIENGTVVKSKEGKAVTYSRA